MQLCSPVRLYLTMYQSLELDQIIVLERAIAPDVQLYAILL